jgi:hypothetical protein
MSVFGVTTGEMVYLGQRNSESGRCVNTPGASHREVAPMTTPKSTPRLTIPQLTEAQVAAFWMRVDRSAGPKQCWPWDRPGPSGYGQVKFNGKTYPAHRVAYTLLIGPIPDGCELDHVRARGCTSRRCCNPAHLEPVSHEVNVLRGESFSAKNARKTHCTRGHALDDSNTYRTLCCGRWRRRCKTCHGETVKKYRARRNGEREDAG